MADAERVRPTFWIPTQSAGDPNRFEFVARQSACAGPPERQFLMGGVSMAAGVHALETAIGRPLLWATAQFAGGATLNSCIDLTVRTLAEGRTVTQAVADLTEAGRPVLHISAALGGWDDSEGRQFLTIPSVPPPSECAESHEIPFSRPDNLAGRIERRSVYQHDATGEEMVWVRVKDTGPPDAALLSLVSDFFLGAHTRTRGGRSLDNTVRIHALPKTEWVLNMTRMSGFAAGAAHGVLYQFGEDGTLLTTASQTGLLPPR
jgi:acyl-CoA thioesterase II